MLKAKKQDIENHPIEMEHETHLFLGKAISQNCLQGIFFSYVKSHLEKHIFSSLLLLNMFLIKL